MEIVTGWNEEKDQVDFCVFYKHFFLTSNQKKKDYFLFYYNTFYFNKL